jgi:hypothetical protein
MYLDLYHNVFTICFVMSPSAMENSQSGIHPVSQASRRDYDACQGSSVQEDAETRRVCRPSHWLEPVLMGSSNEDTET